ncbi:hypothetical protein [Deinococcus cellulosilyticus]|uniref:Uncharacterized protein n=1 Tax=Deinococcus cellulosilyticus (strain DSM 18568 / NBRC 106333 / KACC 11606 / 5516J-15) TaxID=1223518 RepID=A0A511NBU0_DEIC1|nr:hypothetical protein [Deinococcus cellulosilyticus]GEM49831.1 hypothetical protein DC3_54660 [Deinococcus cellulosilyticus NBRC 106333 = KACC 11606]
MKTLWLVVKFTLQLIWTLVYHLFLGILKGAGEGSRSVLQGELERSKKETDHWIMYGEMSPDDDPHPVRASRR